jgi:hypothetical protein
MGRRPLARRIFIDTSFVLAFVNDTDQYHQTAVQLINKFEHYPIVITDAVLLEIGNALARNFKRQAIEIFEHFYTAKQVSIVHLTPALLRRGFDLYRTYLDKSWGLVDCISFVVMRDMGITEVFTCDRHFVQAGFIILEP